MGMEHGLSIHLKEVQKSMDIARINGQQADVWVWEKGTGDIIRYNGWWVIGSHWRKGTHRLKNPENGEIRSLRDINIFRYNKQEVYV